MAKENTEYLNKVEDNAFGGDEGSDVKAVRNQFNNKDTQNLESLNKKEVTLDRKDIDLLSLKLHMDYFDAKYLLLRSNGELETALKNYLNE